MMVSQTYDALLFASMQQRHMMNSYFKHDEQIRIWVVVKHYFQLILLTFLWKVFFCVGVTSLIVSRISVLSYQLQLDPS